MELAGFAPNAQTDFLLLTAGQPDRRPGVSLAAILTSRVPGKDAFSRALRVRDVLARHIHVRDVPSHLTPHRVGRPLGSGVKGRTQIWQYLGTGHLFPKHQGPIECQVQSTGLLLSFT